MVVRRPSWSTPSFHRPSVVVVIVRCPSSVVHRPSDVPDGLSPGIQGHKDNAARLKATMKKQLKESMEGRKRLAAEKKKDNACRIVDIDTSDALKVACFKSISLFLKMIRKRP